MEISLSLSQIFYAIPVICALGLLLRYFETIWRYKCTIASCMAVVGCIGGLIGGICYTPGVPVDQAAIDARWNVSLPGGWYELERVTRQCSYFNVRMAVIEAFATNQAKDEPKLPPRGMDHILSNLVHDRFTDRDWKRFNRATELLTPFLEIPKDTR